MTIDQKPEIHNPTDFKSNLVGTPERPQTNQGLKAALEAVLPPEIAVGVLRVAAEITNGAKTASLGTGTEPNPELAGYISDINAILVDTN